MRVFPMKAFTQPCMPCGRATFLVARTCMPPTQINRASSSDPTKIRQALRRTDLKPNHDLKGLW
jgi:hypothetical protein